MDIGDIASGVERADAFPFEATDIEAVQTQMSLVVLAGGFAYKIKKPIRLDFLDFTTLEKRLHFCEREVQLNRRISPEIYLGVVPITSEGGSLRVEGEGEPIEYAVKMKRLPADRMMNVLLESELVTPAMIDETAGAVADFHKRAETGPEISSFGTPENLEREMTEDLREVEAYTGETISTGALEEMRDFFSGWIREHRGLLSRRVAEGRVRDCHGDMHSRNICLPPGAVDIFDCIEFNDTFRRIDVAREVAFLAMDLDAFDQPVLSKRYVEQYVDLSGDAGLLELLDFYKAWLALVRGKVYSIPVAGASISPKELKYSVIRARRYFELAHGYAGGHGSPTVLVLMGVMGSGKSALSRVLAERNSMHVIDSDFVRKSLAGIGPEEHRNVGFGEDIYSSEMTDRVYRTLAETALKMTVAGYSLIIEASFSKRKQRAALLDLARQTDIDMLFIECTADRAVLEKRLIERQRAGEDCSDGRLDLLPRQLAEFERPDEVRPDMLLVLDTARPLEELADEVMDRIDASMGRSLCPLCSEKSGDGGGD